MCGDFLDLHSFPTRRSSELIPDGYHGCPHCRLSADWLDLLRSEEHTSELQSHVNLVCRLLLEKKKDSGASSPINASSSRSTRQAAVSRGNAARRGKS